MQPADKPVAPGVHAMDCGGRLLMPGLIDAHWHAMMAALPLNVLLTADIGYITLAAADQAERTLMRGFTSSRDMAGLTFSLKRAIDGGILPGPRSPYPGRLGVVADGALADLLVVDGDPLADIKLVADPERNFLVIMQGRPDLQEHDAGGMISGRPRTD